VSPLPSAHSPTVVNLGKLLSVHSSRTCRCSALDVEALRVRYLGRCDRHQSLFILGGTKLLGFTNSKRATKT
jgi:hypothetical protein